MTVKAGDKAGRVILACGAGCEAKDVLSQVGLTFKDLFDKGVTVKDKIVSRGPRYVYESEAGKPLFRVTRCVYDSGRKTFFQNGAKASGDWRKGAGAMKGVRLVLWRLPEVLEAIKAGAEIHLAEGEKDIQALVKTGVAATCHPMGAGKWRPEYTQSLAGAACVVVWADRDASGYRCAHQRLSALLAADIPARAVLPIPDFKGADAHDHLSAGYSAEDGKPVSLEELAELGEVARASEGKPVVSAFAAQTWDDFGNAERMVVRYADRLRWTADNEQWATYDRETGLWVPRGAEQRAAGLARKTVERMGEEEAGNYSAEPGTGKTKEKSQRDDWFAFVRGCRSNARVFSMLSQAKTKRSLQASINGFDANPAILHCTNGVLDLTTFELRDHSPDWLCTITTGTDYLPDAKCSMWKSYLDLFLPDKTLREFVRRIVGYSLIDGNPERLFFFVCGGTSTGKSTLNEMVLSALGGYAKPFNLSIFRANQDEKPRSDIAGVLARRYISAVEASSEWRLHADQIKKITGGDTLAARFPWDRTDTVRSPAFVPFIFTNAIPSIEGRDRALDRRLYVVPFECEVPAESDKRRAREQMTASPASRAALLTWAVEGLRKYQSDGLGAVPDVVLEATSGARREFSDLDRFLSDRCVLEDGCRVRPDDLFEAYEDWCTVNRIKERDELTLTKFGKGIKARGHDRKRARHDGALGWFYVGLDLKTALRIAQ